MSPFLAALILVPQQEPDALLLPIGRAGTAQVRPNQITDLSSGREVALDAVLDHAAKSKFVYIGESHTSGKHHLLQAAVIDGLASRGMDVIVGFEMFTRPVQDAMDPWTLGWWTEEQFIERSDWKKQWGFDYALYKPIFDATRKHRLRMVALNVPRDWVRAVGRGGWNGLTAEQKGQLPAWTPSAPRHREIIQAMIGGNHPMAGNAADNMYAAQNLWDLGMADSAVRYLKNNYVGRKTVFVVVAGSGHVMYNLSIPYRINEYLGPQPSTTIVCVDTDKRRQVSRGLGDFVYAAEPPPEKPPVAGSTKNGP